MLPGPRTDPVETDPKFTAILAQAEAAAERELGDRPQGMGFCHTFWRTKKRILREEFRVHRRTPAELNPEVRFD